MIIIASDVHVEVLPSKFIVTKIAAFKTFAPNPKVGQPPLESKIKFAVIIRNDILINELIFSVQ